METLKIFVTAILVAFTCSLFKMYSYLHSVPLRPLIPTSLDLPKFSPSVMSPLQDSDFSTEVFHSPEVFKVNYLEMEKNFKIFVYPDGDDDTVCRTPRKLYGKYASEGYFFKNIRESWFLTKDPNKAHMFFIPISCHKLRGQGRSYGGMATTVWNYVQSLISKYPYWNKTLGADHFFVTCHDIGITVTEQHSALVKNLIRVVCSPSYRDKYIPHKDVSLPQIVQPFALPAGGNDIANRTALGFWAGHRNSDIRDKLVRTWENDIELDIQSNYINSTAKGHLVYQEKFYRSKFCICPRGSEIHGARIADAIHYGCVPVILSDHYDLPFNDILDWRKISVILKENNVYRLKKILQAMPDAEYRALQNNTVQVQKHFQWNSPPIRLDAFHMVMYELWLRHHVTRF